MAQFGNKGLLEAQDFGTQDWFGNSGTVLTWGQWAGLGLGSWRPSRDTTSLPGAGLGTGSWSQTGDTGSVPELGRGAGPGLGTGGQAGNPVSVLVGSQLGLGG